MKMTVKEALEQVFNDLDAMSPEEFRAEIEKHKDGDIAQAFRDIGDFMSDLKENEPKLFAKVTQ